MLKATSLLLFMFFCIAANVFSQLDIGGSKPNAKTYSKPSTPSCTATITWNGSKAVKLVLENTELFLKPGISKTIPVGHEKGYGLRVILADQQVLQYSEWIMFEKGGNYLDVYPNAGVLSVKQKSEAQKQSEIKAAREASERKRTEAARNTKYAEYYGKGKSFYDQSDLANAEKSLKEAIKYRDDSEAELLLQKVSKEITIEKHLSKGDAYLAQKNYASAEAAYKKAYLIDYSTMTKTKLVAVSNTRTFNELLIKADGLYKNKQYKEAGNIYKSDLVEMSAKLGDAKREFIYERIKFCEDVVKKEENAMFVQNMRVKGDEYYAQKEYQKALIQYKEVAGMEPSKEINEIIKKVEKDYDLHKEIIKRAEFEELIKEAQTDLANAEYEKALDGLDIALIMYPTDSIAQDLVKQTNIAFESNRLTIFHRHCEYGYSAKSKDDLYSSVGYYKKANKLIDTDSLPAIIESLEEKIAELEAFNLKLNNAMLEAESAERFRRYVVARQTYEKVLELDPDHEAAKRALHDLPTYQNQRLAVELINEHDYKNAIKAGKKAVKFDPTIIETHLCLGDAYYLDEDYQRAYNSYVEVLGIEPTHSRALERKAFCHKEYAGDAAALDDFSILVDSDPTNTKVRRSKAEIGFSQQKFDEAYTDLSELLKIKLTSEIQEACLYERGLINLLNENYSEASSDFSALTKLNSTMALAHYHQGLVQLKLKKTANAKENFELALSVAKLNLDANAGPICHSYFDGISITKIEPKKKKDNELGALNSDKNSSIMEFVQSKNTDFSTNCYERGMNLKNSNNNDEAIESFTNAIILQNIYPDAYYDRAMVYLASNDIPNATSDLTACINQNDQHSRAFFERGAIYYAQKLYDKSSSDFSVCSVLTPDKASPSLYAGQAFFYWERYDKAVSYYKKAIENEKSSSIVFDTIYNNLGLSYHQLKQYKEANDAYSSSIKLNEKYTNAYYNRAMTAYAIKDYKNAITDFTSAINRDPSLENAFFLRGKSYKNEDELTDAKEDLRAVITLNNKHDRALYTLTEVCSELNQFEDAVNFYEKLFVLDPKKLTDESVLRTVLSYCLEGADKTKGSNYYAKLIQITTETEELKFQKVCLMANSGDASGTIEALNRMEQVYLSAKRLQKTDYFKPLKKDSGFKAYIKSIK